jgi:hypothetical protein
MIRLSGIFSALLSAIFLSMSLSTARADLAEEVLLLPVPKGWNEISNVREGSTVTIEYAAPGYKSGEAGDVIIRKVYYGGAATQDAEYYFKRESSLESRNCPGSTSTLVKQAQEGGHDFAFWWSTCPSHPTLKRGQVTAAKVIRGGKDLFAVFRLRTAPAFSSDKLPLSESEVAEWSRYMKAVRVCAASDRNCQEAEAR